MVLREAYWLASILAIVERERELSPATAAALLSHSAACFAVTFTQCVLHQEAGMRDVQWVPAWADLCPSRLVPARERLIARLRRLADRIGPVRARPPAVAPSAQCTHAPPPRLPRRAAAAGDAHGDVGHRGVQACAGA